ncbi:hypothetical protein [Clostridium sp. SHJSY1]|uniref:hypothetical protein n=1 Tax=Clostridium sp. SHJSY1 TaxID=2942483 RepID=UPI00287B9A81|nr:hypothetical protein [Clostridium sp. SHJSY1]
MFIYFYRANYENIIGSIEKTPSWISKTTFVFLMYFSIFLVINIIVIGIVSRSIKMLKISTNSVEVQFEDKIKIIEGLNDISSLTSSITVSNAKLIDAMDNIVRAKFYDIDLSKEYDIDIFFDFYSEIVTTLFSETMENVNARVICNDEENELKSIVDEVDCSIIVKANTLDKIISGHIVRLSNYLFVPVSMELIETNAIVIVSFDKEENCITYFGNIIYALIKYTDTVITNVLSDKALQELDEYISNL